MGNAIAIMIMVLSALTTGVAVVLAARTLVDAVRDREALRRRQVGNGRRVVAEGEVREGLVRFALAGVLSVSMVMILYVIGTASSSPLRPSVSGVLVTMLMASALLVYDAVVAQRTRRKLLRRMREEWARGTRDDRPR